MSKKKTVAGHGRSRTRRAPTRQYPTGGRVATSTFGAAARGRNLENGVTIWSSDAADPRPLHDAIVPGGFLAVICPGMVDRYSYRRRAVVLPHAANRSNQSSRRCSHCRHSPPKRRSPTPPPALPISPS